MDTTKNRKAAGRTGRTGRAARRSPSTEALTRKSLALPSTTAAAAENLAAVEGVSVSAWVTRAIDEAAARARQDARVQAITAELIADFEAEHGEISAEAYAEADAFLTALTDEPTAEA